MPVETAADRATFLSAAEFGAQGVYTPVGGAASQPFAGIFDDPSIGVDLANGGIPTLDGRPSFCCREQDLPAGAEGGDAGDTLAVSGKGSFSVLAIKPDGQGMALLLLGRLG